MGSTIEPIDNKIYQLFFNSLLEGGFVPIAQTVYDLLHFPIIMNDEAGSTMLQMPDSPLGDPDWDYSLQHKSIQREHYLQLYQNIISDPTKHNRPLMIYEGYRQKQHQIICDLTVERLVSGTDCNQLQCLKLLLQP